LFVLVLRIVVFVLVLFVVFLVALFLVLELLVVLSFGLGDFTGGARRGRGWGRQRRDADASRLAAEAEQTRAALAQDLDVDLFATEAQLLQGLFRRFVDGPPAGRDVFHVDTSCDAPAPRRPGQSAPSVRSAGALR